MEGKEVVVCFGASLSILQASDYPDLLRQTRNTIPGLPAAFHLTSASRKINSESAFQSLNCGQGNMLVVTEEKQGRKITKRKKGKTGVITDVPRVRLSNLAYINQQKAKRPDVVEVLESVPEEVRCPICLERLRKPMKAKCGHILCEACWDQTLSHALECPLCRNHVRKKTLRTV